MPGEVPIACSLSGGEATVRAAALARLGERSLIASSIDDRIATLRFTLDAKDELATVVAAESSCCPFFTFDVVESESEITVQVSAPEDGAFAVNELVAAFTADRKAA